MSYFFVDVKDSNLPNKKLMAIFANKDNGRIKKVHFGAKGYEHYTEGHLDEERRIRYEERHKKRENFNDPLTAGYWAYRYLWLHKTYKKAESEIKKDLKKRGY